MALTINPGAAWRGLLGGRTKERSQMVLVGTEDGRQVSKETSVNRACAVIEETETAYLLDPNNQFKDESDGRWYQWLGERSAVPICPIKPTGISNLTNLMEQIFRENFEATKDYMYQKAQKTSLGQRFVWLISALVVAAIAVFFITAMRK